MEEDQEDIAWVAELEVFKVGSDVFRVEGMIFVDGDIDEFKGGLADGGPDGTEFSPVVEIL